MKAKRAVTEMESVLRLYFNVTLDIYLITSRP
jgi:hypothetical protein